MNILAENKKAYFDYNILEKFEAGLALLGTEVKSIRAGHMGLKGAYVVVDRNGEVSLIGANISAYQPKNAPDNYRSDRSRKLLLRKKEIDYLIGKSHQKGLTFIPLRVYNNKGRIKLEFGIGKGKREFDKRDSIKKRDLKREIDRELKVRG
ncbi:MAG: SsrA-binding protein SmpB [Candidatus Nealsonbacteria bacterium]